MMTGLVRTAIFEGVLVFLMSSCAFAPHPSVEANAVAENQRLHEAEQRSGSLPEFCREPWTVPERNLSVLTAEAVVRALGPAYGAIQKAVCRCLGSAGPGGVEGRIRFLITSKPEEGRATAAVVSVEGGAAESGFLECLGEIEAEFEPWQLGSCTDPKEGRATVVSPLTIVLGK